MISTDDIKTIHCLDAGSQRLAIDLYGVTDEELGLQLIESPYVLVGSYGEKLPLNRLIGYYDQAGTNIGAIAHDFATAVRSKWNNVSVKHVDSVRADEMPSGCGGRVAWEENGYRTLRKPLGEIAAYAEDGECKACVRVGYLLDDDVRVRRSKRAKAS